MNVSPAAVTARLRRLGELAVLQPERRFDTKVDLTAAAIIRRLRVQSRLRYACGRLAQLRGTGSAVS